PRDDDTAITKTAERLQNSGANNRQPRRKFPAHRRLPASAAAHASSEEHELVAEVIICLFYFFNNRKSEMLIYFVLYQRPRSRDLHNIIGPDSDILPEVPA